MTGRHRLVLLALASAGGLAAATPVTAASPPISSSHVIVHLDLSRGQTPESIALEPDGTANVTFSLAAQVARVSPDGSVRILAQLPTSSGGASCPVPGLGHFAAGIARDHQGTLYIAYCSGSAGTQGIWRVSPGGSPIRVAALPAAGFPNGLALDERRGLLYVADSLLSTVWRVSLADRTVSAWSTGPQLAPGGFVGANGLKLHGGAVWVSNTRLGTLLRIPIQADGSAGAIQTVGTGLGGIDDFAFTGSEPRSAILATIDSTSKVVLLRPDGSRRTVLTGADGLSTPTSIALRGGTVYVASAAVLTRRDPNVLLARLEGEP